MLLSKLENKLELGCMEQYSTRLNCCDHERIIFRNFMQSFRNGLKTKKALNNVHNNSELECEDFYRDRIDKLTLIAKLLKSKLKSLTSA